MMIQNDSCFWDGLKSPMGYIEVLVSFFVGSVSWFGVFQSHFSSALYIERHLSACSFALKALIQTLSTACPDLLAGDGQPPGMGNLLQLLRCGLRLSKSLAWRESC